MCMLPHCVHERLSNGLNSHMFAEDRTALITSSVHNNDTRSCKLLRSYPEVVVYILKKYATDRALVEYDASSLRHVQPINMTP